jgi:S-adenosylmethionine:tRNA ribosyltransferase-isomerase
LKTSLFDFTLPNHLIATQPANPRDSAKMLVVADHTADHHVSQFPQFLKSGDVLVFNDTKVIPARLFGKRGDANIECLLHKRVEVGTWKCFAKPAKKLRIGDTVIFANDFQASVMDKLESGEVVLQFSYAESVFYQHLAKHGHMPLPPYIERQDNVSDQTSYQTIYAKHEGSVAAPTAGLHFTPELLAAIDAAGVKRVHITLHVGGGTFLPVKVEDTTEHLMHSEYAVVTSEAADAINQAKAAGGRVIAVGTTSMRTLESATDEAGKVQPFAAETAIFITPGYLFKCVDVLLTNFHLPKSTLFMLISAFSGLERMQKAYAHAISNNYRFYSYGDACLLYRQN